MINFKNFLYFVFIAMVFVGRGFSDEQRDDLQRPGALHRRIKETGGDCYLVCEYSLEAVRHSIRPLAEEGLYELQIKAVVVEVISGRLRKGDRLEYQRYSGDRNVAEKAAGESLGGLVFVFRQKSPQGELFVDPQDPHSMIRYTPGNEKIFSDLFKGGATK